MILRMLGDLALEGSDFRRYKPLLLLSYLALEGPQPRERLSRLFWPDATNPLNRLAVTLRRVRAAAPDAVHAEGATLRSRLQTDVALVEEALARCDHEEVLARYEGAFLDGSGLPPLGTELESWILQRREGLAGRIRTLVVDGAEGEAAAGRYRNGVGLAERARRIAGAPPAPPELLERLHAVLVAGDSDEARSVRDEAAEFGLELVPGRARARASLRAARTPVILPRAPTSFVGRDVERLELGRILARDDHPLLTLLGLGGVGKTRLALALAHDVASRGTFEAGVHFVSLEDVSDGAAVAAAVANAMGVVPAPHETDEDALARTVGQRRVLWVLDNVDDLVEDAPTLARLLACCPAARIVATSRVRLDLEEESVFPLEGLPVPQDDSKPDTDGDAVHLFLDRAKRVRLDYAPDALERKAIARMCRLVDGVPLGIELAAFLLRDGSAVDAEASLKASMDALAATSRNRPERHLTLRASFDASWTRLSETQREALRRLAVFHGGFDAASAHDVAGADADTLEALIGASLISRWDDGRFAVHPLVRTYAVERLEEEEDLAAALAARHAAHFLNRARAWSAAYYGPRQHEAQRWFDLEAANLTAAGAYGREHDPQLALDLVDAQWHRWRFSGRFAEGRTQALAGLASADGRAEHGRSRALHVAGAMAYRLGDHEAARDDLQAARAAAASVSDDEAELRAVQTLGNVAIEQRRLDEAEAYFSETLSRARQRGDINGERGALTGLGEVARLRGDFDEARAHYGRVLDSGHRDEAATSIATSHHNLGLVAWQLGDLDAARSHMEQALERDGEIGDRWGVATALHMLAGVMQERNDLLGAERSYHEALQMYLDMGDARGVADVTFDLGLVARKRGKLDEARRAFLETVQRWVALGEEGRTVDSLWALASLATLEERPEVAARLWGVETAVLERYGLVRTGEEGEVHTRDVEATRSQLAPARFRAAWQEGTRSSVLDAVAWVGQDAAPDDPPDVA
ncbi:MAG: tetratricopeptide repeat protein [Trueperaceae bacterium]|nr:tetratricopeptide repeat protein [Trueperaceae bacterium]